ncbi:hypothetical protein [uncultured Actinomyces sp.]|uniref:hypothetical protein n=1 Tax=uncultured Actinomyces sp. TaxID=249061 RepID=UPI0026185D26|nr:hypothetical protein [uncultured Actinomyces sp.]
MISDSQWKWAQGTLGDIDRAEFETVVTEFGSVRDAAVSILVKRRQKLIAQPLSVSIPGAFSVSMRDNVAAIDSEISRLRALPQDGESDSSSVGFHIADRWRRV